MVFWPARQVQARMCFQGGGYDRLSLGGLGKRIVFFWAGIGDLRLNLTNPPKPPGIEPIGFGQMKPLPKPVRLLRDSRVGMGRLRAFFVVLRVLRV